MFGQTFALSDLFTVLSLVFLEGVLSGDNALVMAMTVHHLRPTDQRRALFFGLVGAFAFRLIAILLASTVLRLWWLQAMGAGYLIFLPIRHFVSHRENPAPEIGPGSFWRTVIMVELVDIAFAMDSVLAGVSFVGNRWAKIWVVYLGAVIGIVLLRCAATLCIALLEKFPLLTHVAYVLVGWVGLKLLMLAAHSLDQLRPEIIPGEVHEMSALVFWSVLLTVAVCGSYLAMRTGKSMVPKPKIDLHTKS